MKSQVNTYCSNVCLQRNIYNKYVDRWLNGDELGYGGKTCDMSHHIYRYMRDTFGTACSVCGWDEKHPVDGSVLTEIDHVDGDAKNCSLSNLKILCPNCHSMTPTFRARNSKSSRTRKPL